MVRDCRIQLMLLTNRLITLSLLLLLSCRLCVFYYGVNDRLREGGYLTDRSVLAGTSGGALGALIGCVPSISGRQGNQTLQKILSDNPTLLLLT